MNPSKPVKSLKAANLPWLVSLVVLDIFIGLGLASPDLVHTTSITQFTIARAMLASVSPVAVLLLSGLLPHNIKAWLVYWKVSNALPAHDAFTKHCYVDARIDVESLRKDIGNFPTAPAEQNRLWFKLYKAVETEPAVSEAHKMYLLYRDMAAISALLLIIVPIGLYLDGTPLVTAGTGLAVFALQYLIASIAARHSGIRFVTNVLTIHSAKPISRPAKSAPPRKSKSSVPV